MHFLSFRRSESQNLMFWSGTQNFLFQSETQNLIFWSETENVYLQEIRESDNPEENWGRISQISQMKNLKGKHWDTSLSRDFYFRLVWSGGSI